MQYPARCVNDVCTGITPCPAGAAFLEVLTTFKRECVYQALQCQALKDLFANENVPEVDSKAGSTPDGSLQASAGKEGADQDQNGAVKPANGLVHVADGNAIPGQDSLEGPTGVSVPDLARV